MTPLVVLLAAKAMLQGVGADQPVALMHATVIDGRGGPALPDATIIIDSGRIAAVGPTATVVLPPHVRTIDLAGRVVTPGFIDMHYHVTTAAMRYHRTAAGALDSTYDRSLAERLLKVALSRGITTIRDPGASPVTEAVSLRNDVRNGRIPGPRIFTAGSILSSPRLSADEIRGSVRDQSKAGIDYIKLYAGITLPQLRVAVEEAHRHGLKVIGHLQRTSWTDAALSGIDFITHGGNWHDRYLPPFRRESYAALGGGMRARIAWLEWLEVDGPAVDTMIRALSEHGVSIDPTLVAYHTKFWWRDCLYQNDPDSALVPEVLANWRVLGMPTADWAPGEFSRAQRAGPNSFGSSDASTMVACYSRPDPTLRVPGSYLEWRSIRSYRY